MEELELLKATAQYAEQVMECKKEYLAVNSSMDGCGPMRRTDDPMEYLKLCALEEDPETCPAPLVPATQFILVRKGDNRVVGFLQVRHKFNDYLKTYGGHIGYSVRPSERRKGYAKKMLCMALPFCREVGLGKVLITCNDDNIGSEKTILANGGVYESTVAEQNGKKLKRFWIEL